MICALTQHTFTKYLLSVRRCMRTSIFANSYALVETFLVFLCSNRASPLQESSSNANPSGEAFQTSLGKCSFSLNSHVNLFVAPLKGKNEHTLFTSSTSKRPQVTENQGSYHDNIPLSSYGLELHAVPCKESVVMNHLLCALA